MTQDNNFSPKPQEEELTITSSKISRRFLLGAIPAAAVVLALPEMAVARGGNGSGGGKGGGKARNRVQLATDPIDFSEPDVLSSNSGELAVGDFTVMETDVTIPCLTADPITVRAYKNGSNDPTIPGPTFQLNPGEKITMNFQNRLPLNPTDGGTSSTDPYCPDPVSLGTWDPFNDEVPAYNAPKCFNSTNMHFHGLHVSPGTAADGRVSDNVLINVEPPGQDNGLGGDREYCVWLPDHHAPGTHWYHSHHHGATGLQVSNGMAGAIIIPEPDENAMGIDPDHDKIWLLQEVVGDAGNSQYKDLGVYVGRSNSIPGDFVVNGLCKPTLTINSAELYRWRFINATSTPRGFTKLVLLKFSGDPNADISTCTCPEGLLFNANLTMNLIAVDGISFYGKPPKQVTEWDFGSGNRADFLVCLDPGTYVVVKEAMSGNGTTASQRSAQVLGYVRAEANLDPANDNEQKECPDLPETIPGTLPYYLTPIEDGQITASGVGSIANPRSFDFTVQSFGLSSDDPNSNDPAYKDMTGEEKRARNQYFVTAEQEDNNDPEQFHGISNQISVNLNAVERWQLTTPTTGGNSAHPFHIHVNPFQVEGKLIDDSQPDTPDNRIWMDTITVLNTDTPTYIRTRFLDYPGDFVFHCHILIHEDRGMMRQVHVVDTGVESTGPCESLDRDTL